MTIKLPSRSSKYSVGKEIGGAVYLHRLYESVLPEVFLRCKEKIGKDLDYTVVKFAEKAKTVSFIVCPDFDAADEPVVGDLDTVTFKGLVKRRKQLTDPYIYHHKWLFVRDDYEGFNTEESKERSRLWLELPDVDKARIGRKSYWESEVIPKLTSDSVSWLRSKEMAARLRVSACELSRLRIAGKLTFKKQGNAFLYRVEREKT